MPRARLGQNFLSDSAWRQRIARALDVRADQTWLEIGSGHGEMTELLAPRAGRLVAIEVDPPLAAQIRRRAQNWPNVALIESDVLKLDLAEAAGAPRFHVYGNIPYYITSPILHLLFAHALRIDSAHLVMQLEVAERLAANPGARAYGYLSAATQFHFAPKIELRIPPGAFRPAPKVTSALVSLRPPGVSESVSMEPNSAEAQRFLEFVGVCFAHKRKTLLNNLKSPRKFASGQLEELLRAAEIPLKSRAEQLTIPKFARLFRAMANS